MAARAIAAAVLRPMGSVSTRLRAAAGSCARTAAACSAFVTVQMRSGRMSGRYRARRHFLSLAELRQVQIARNPRVFLFSQRTPIARLQRNYRQREVILLPSPPAEKG